MCQGEGDLLRQGGQDRVGAAELKGDAGRRRRMCHEIVIPEMYPNEDKSLSRKNNGRLAIYMPTEQMQKRKSRNHQRADDESRRRFFHSAYLAKVAWLGTGVPLMLSPPKPLDQLSIHTLPDNDDADDSRSLDVIGKRDHADRLPDPQPDPRGDTPVQSLDPVLLVDVREGVGDRLLLSGSGGVGRLDGGLHLDSDDCGRIEASARSPSI